MVALQTFFGFLILTSAVVAVFYVYPRRYARTLPPGPTGWPIIGNLLDMPTSRQWLKFAEWGNIWGDIMSVQIFGQRIIILNSYEHAVNLLDKRSAIYSDRQTLTLAGSMVGWDHILVLTPYGNTFREIRQLLHQFIGSRNKIVEFYPCIEAETNQFLAQLLKNPKDFEKHIRRAAGAIILSLSYGYQVKAQDNDQFVDLVNTGMDQFTLLTTPGAFVVDTFPILKHVPSWLPGAGWKQKVPLWTETLQGVCRIPHEFAKRQVASGSATMNFTSDHLNTDLTADQEDLIMYAASSLYTGGADTVVSAIHSFFLAMTCYPDVQRKAQLEIDTVIGNDRLPTAADRESLPYIHALCLEVYRWNPVGPLAVPHRLMEDDVYESYHLPKGAIVIPNIWQITHDDQTYPCPNEFNPDRFVSSNDHKAERDPRGVIFGFGRRICPGQYLADASVFVSVAMTLATFNVVKAVEDGKVIEPIVEYTPGTISHPKPFPCSIQPRSAKHEVLIRA